MNNDLSLEQIQKYIDEYHETHDSVGDLSDGYHTFNELYRHRSMLFLSLCLTSFRNKAWKSLSHEVGGDPMYNGMFIGVGNRQEMTRERIGQLMAGQE